MPQPKKAAPVDPAKERQERIDAVMKELRPKMEAMLQKMVLSLTNPRPKNSGTSSSNCATWVATWWRVCKRPA